MLEAASVDVVVTSPPYNLGLSYRAYDDRLAENEYLDWLTNVATEIRRVMRPDGSFFLNISGSSSAPWLPFELIVRLRPLFVLQNHITWIKSIATKSDAIGHFKPVGGQSFLHHNHEHIFHLTLSGEVKLDRLAIGVPFKDKSNIARRGHAQDLRCRGNTWFIPYDTVQTKAAKFHHPGTFPVALPRWCIRLHGRSDATVLDPFMGTGTTLVAAELEGVTGIGIDIDLSYVAIARRRLAEASRVQQRLEGI
jgi:site-specific DNA-methyltransferase (adenine-specific)